MTQTSIFEQQARAAEGRREALRWLAGRLKWEHRLGQLRPSTGTAPAHEAKQAA
jgi:hypothetical protein